MQSWHTTYLGLRELPREISTFELQSFFTYSRTERELINARRSNAHKLGLALHIGFLRLSGRLLNSERIVPTTLWRHLGDENGKIGRASLGKACVSTCSSRGAPYH